MSKDVTVKVLVTLEEEIRLDPDEALGEIELVGDDGNSIQRGNAWLDEWLSAVLSGIQGLRAGEKEQRIEVMAETNPLVFRTYRRGVRITFRDDTIEVKKIAQLETELKDAVRRVIERLERHDDFSPDATWSRLSEYAGS